MLGKEAPIMCEIGEAKRRRHDPQPLELVGEGVDGLMIEAICCLGLWKEDGMWLKKIPIQTVKIIEVALRQNGLALKDVSWDTLAKHRSKREMDELRTHFYQIAIQQNPYAIKYIPNPSEELCLAALRHDSKGIVDEDYDDPLMVIDQCFNLTPRMVFEAIRQRGERLIYVPRLFRTSRIWLEAIKQEPEVIDSLIGEKGIDSKVLEELLWLIGITHNESLWEESFAPWLTSEFKWLAAIGPRYRKDRPIQQSFYRLTDEMTLLMENFMFDCPNEVNPEPFFSTYINQQYERKSMAQTLELNPMVLMLMENRFKSFRLCRYAMRLIAKEEKGLLNELKRHSPYHLLEVLEAR